MDILSVGYNGPNVQAIFDILRSGPTPPSTGADFQKCSLRGAGEGKRKKLVLRLTEYNRFNKFFKNNKCNVKKSDILFALWVFLASRIVVYILNLKEF